MRAKSVWGGKTVFEKEEGEINSSGRLGAKNGKGRQGVRVGDESNLGPRGKENSRKGDWNTGGRGGSLAEKRL